MFSIGQLVKDNRRNTVQTIVKIDYKRGQELYTVKRIDGTYRRYYADKFSRHFSLYTDNVAQTGTGSRTKNRANTVPTNKGCKPSNFSGMGIPLEAFTLDSSPAPAPSPEPSRGKKPAKGKPALVWYVNVIYIDFIKRCKIDVKP